MDADERRVARVCETVTDEQAETLCRFRVETGMSPAIFDRTMRTDGTRAIRLPGSTEMLANIDPAGFNVVVKDGRWQRQPVDYDPPAA